MMLFRLFALVTLSAAGYIRAQAAPLAPSPPDNVEALSRTQIQMQKRQINDLQVAATKPGGARMVSDDPRPPSALRAKPDSLDRYILADMKARHIPAVVFGVFKDGKILRSGAYGHSNLELGVPATINTVFEIGSVSKQFTATLILKLMEEGKLSLDDPIGKFVDSLPEAWRQIKLRNLLNHTSGIPDIEEIFGYDSYRNRYTVGEIIKVANSRPVAFAAGTKFHYSNTNYYLLALAIQTIDHKTYSQSLQDRIFKPLGMTHTRESDPWVIIPNRASGYMFTDKGEIVNRDPMQPTACLGAGTIISTIGDMAKWDAAINHHKILRRDSQELMWTPTKLTDGSTVEYGFGWFISPWNGHPSVEHSGGTAGFSCDYRRFTDSGISVMVFSNLYATGVGNYEIRAVDTIQPGLSYLTSPALPEDDSAVRTRLLAGMKDVASGATTSNYVSPRMMERYSAVSRADWKTRLQEMVRFELVAHEKYAPKDAGNGEIVSETYIYRLTLRKATLIITFKLTPDGKVGWQTRSDY
jgi:D-alanyl-D-alanine carboxypeptidase